jgi:uncharacterized protein YecT (DUF1311 family)
MAVVRLMRWRRALCASLLLAGLLGGSPARAQQGALSAECGLPQDAIDRTICGTPALAMSDAAMAFAERELERELPTERRAALRLDQQTWVRARAGSCGDIAGEAQIGCLSAETEARRRMLTGGGVNRDRGTPSLVPAFFREAKSGRYEIDVAYPQILAPATPAQRAFNQAAHDVVLGDAALMSEFRSVPLAGGGEAGTSNSAFYDIHYLGPHLATVVFWLLSGNRRMQHPFTARETLNFDFALGRQLRPDDLLIAPAKAALTIADLCRRRLSEEAQREGWKLRADPAATIVNFRNWALGPFAIDILFDPGTIAGEAAGLHTCRLDYAELFSLLKRRAQ